MYIYIHTYTHIHVYTYIYIYIYRIYSCNERIFFSRKTEKVGGALIMRGSFQETFLSHKRKPQRKKIMH